MSLFKKIKTFFKGDNKKATLPKSLHEMLPDGELREDSVFFPAWNLSITPSLLQATANGVAIRFVLTCPLWDRDIIEEAVAAGSSVENAINSALFDFSLRVMKGIRPMLNDLTKCRDECDCNEETESCVSEYEGNTHRWKVYFSNVTNVGEESFHMDVLDMGGSLIPAVLARLGNQKISYIKLYSARFGDKIIGEGRVNNIVSREISAMLEDYAAKLSDEVYTSHKVFIFFVQEEETRTPYPHTQDQLAQHTRTALQTFSSLSTSFHLESYIDELAKKTGDIALARELALFIPELCAEIAWPCIDTGEKLTIVAEGEPTEFFKAQLPSYYLMKTVIQSELQQDALDHGAFDNLLAVSATSRMVENSNASNLEAVEEGNYGMSFEYDFLAATVRTSAYFKG